jgi:hypothetical protein
MPCVPPFLPPLRLQQTRPDRSGAVTAVAGGWNVVIRDYDNLPFRPTEHCRVIIPWRRFEQGKNALDAAGPFS